MGGKSEKQADGKALSETGVQNTRFLNLFELSDQEQEQLRTEINKYGGVVTVIVHPYHFEVEENDRRITSEYREELHKVFSSEEPLVIFEEEGKILTLQQRLAQTRPGRTIYVVPTFFEDPTPFIPGQHNAVRHSTTSEERASWNYFADRFRSSGVMIAEVGGRYLYNLALEDELGIPDEDALAELRDLRELAKDKPYAKEWLEQRVLPFGCGGSTALSLLRQGFDVRFSPAASPGIIPLR